MRSFGPYEVVRRLGAGGFGAVYEVRHRETGGAYALKALLPLHDEEERRRFEREAEAMARLDHPHVARVHAADLSGPEPYLVQELLPGGDLNRLLAAGPLELERALELTRQVASGLAHAHAAGVLHRDLKPGNVLLDGEGRAKLVDFGLARLSGRSRLTETHAVMGTPAYMAPEQARGEGYDERSDVYALGALLYTLLAGEPPFRSKGSVLVLLAAINKEPPPPLSERRPDAPGWVVELCERALAKSPSERPVSAGALLRALEQGAPAVSRPSLPPLLALALLCVAGGLAAATNLAQPVPPPSPSALQSLAPSPDSSPAPTASPRSEAPQRSGWDLRLKAGQGRCFVSLERGRLLTLDAGGSARVWPLGPEGPLERRLLCQVPDLAPNAAPLAFWQRSEGWYLCYLPGGIARVRGRRLVESLTGRVDLCQPTPEGAWITPLANRLRLESWRPNAESRPLFTVKDPKLRGVESSRYFVRGVARFPEGDPRLLVWSQRRILLWKPGEEPRVLEDEVASEYKNMHAAVHPRGDDYVWANNGTFARFGRLSRPRPAGEKAPWLPIPDDYKGAALRALVFLPGERLCGVARLAKRVIVFTWNFPQRKLLGTWEREGGEPTSCSLAPERDLLAIGTLAGEVLLVGVDLLGG
ncbi:MAG TPA: hypothetical protein DEA08_26665 [Planctomycetes bacterium]|nr:hypothetical protein [Planctomycetota bacterium]